MYISLTNNGSFYLYLGKLKIEVLGGQSHAYPFGRLLIEFGRWKILDIYPGYQSDNIDPDDIPF